jgi:ABC-type sugar transport system ATPase subunit
VQIDNPNEALNAGIAYLAENRTESLVSSLDVAKNITLARLNDVFRAGLMLNRNKETNLAEEFIKWMHIEATGVGQLVRQLSGGNQQKVAIARLIHSNAKVFILDEPTRGIDVGAKVEVYNLIYRLLLEGKAIVLISSELPEIVSLSDRVIVVYKGRTVAEYAGEEISQENIMQSATGREVTNGYSVSDN